MLLRILVSDRTKELKRIYVEAIRADVLWDQFGCPPTRLIYPRLITSFSIDYLICLVILIKNKKSTVVGNTTYKSNYYVASKYVCNFLKYSKLIKIQLRTL